MTAVHTGTKRSYHQMRDSHLDARNILSLPSSREQSPSGRTPVNATSVPAPYRIRSAAGHSSTRRTRRTAFGTSASIVLVGVRGTGKSSLGVIAAAAYNYRLIESQRAFSDATGHSPSSYRASHGNGDYQRQSREVLEATLESYSQKTVIVCSFSDLEDGGGALLQDYALDHPVLHITRDELGLHKYFKTWSLGRVRQLLAASAPILRACSNFEFFNLTEEAQAQAPTDLQASNGRARETQGRFLTLKRVERDFLRLLRNIVGDHGRSIAHHSAYPLSQIDVDRRMHTFAVRLYVLDVIEGTLDLEAAQIGADCIELVVTSNSHDKQRSLQDLAHAFAIVRRGSILPIWLSVSTADADETTDALYETIGFCLTFGPELCSADARLSDTQLETLITVKGSTKLILSSSLIKRPTAGWMDKQCQELCERSAQLGLDIVKITMPTSAGSSPFASKVLQAEMKSSGLSLRLIAYEEGADGRTSKCFNDILTSVQPPTGATGRPTDGDEVRSVVTAKSITEALFANFTLEPQRFYIYGRDVSYSLSPAMGNAAYAACGMKHELTTFNCVDLEGFRKLADQLDFGGAAILQPFKTAVMPMIQSVSSHAKAIGAVNTVIPVRRLNEDGSMPAELEIISQRNRQGPLLGLYGTNTDWIGIRSCLRRGLSPANSIRPASTGLVCGAGGMARAAIHSLASLGCQNIFICNRTPAHAHVLADSYNRLIEAGDIPDLGTTSASKTHVTVIESFADDWPSNVRHPTMIACCVPADDADGTAIDFELPSNWLKSPTGGVVVEVAYKRPITPLVNQIRALADQGWILHDGFDVLPEQAYAQFEMFTGRRAPRKLMKDQVLKHYHAMTTPETNG